MMNHKYIIAILVLLLLFSESSFAQEKNKKNYFPIWTFHQRNIKIHGISLGIGSLPLSKPRYTNTNGIKIEIIGTGLFVLLAPKSNVAQTKEEYLRLKRTPISERINGLNLSLTGTTCQSITNGVSAGLLGQFNYQVNGISLSLLKNFTQVHNGIQIAAENESYYMNGLQIGVVNGGHISAGMQTGLFNMVEYLKGIQIGLFNGASDLRGIQIGIWNKSSASHGIQIGLWNKNGKRSLPIINW